jgi:hypothetical protein
MSVPRTARAAVGDYCYYVIDHGNNRALAFSIGRLDDPMTALLGLDASPRPIGRPQAPEEMQHVPIITLGVLTLLNSVLLGSVFVNPASQCMPHDSMQGTTLGATSHTTR